MFFLLMWVQKYNFLYTVVKKGKKHRNEKTDETAGRIAVSKRWFVDAHASITKQSNSSTNQLF